MYSPLITIVLTTYNRAHLISDTLDSIINQTYKNWNCIIIDDNSIDNTYEVVSKYLNKDKRIKYHLKEGEYVKGLSASRNMGMDLVKHTDYIQFFDDDDIMHPQKFEFQILEFKRDKNLDLTIFPTVNFKNGDKLAIESVIYESGFNIKNIAEDFILGRKMFTAQVPLVKWNYIKNIRFNESLFYAEEWEVFNKLFFTKKTKASYVNIPLYFHRKHDLSITTNLYGKTDINQASNNVAFINVYNVVKDSYLFNGRIFGRFMIFALSYKNSSNLLNYIKKDLRKGLFSSKIKNNLILLLLFFIKINKKIFIKIILRTARW